MSITKIQSLFFLNFHFICPRIRRVEKMQRKKQSWKESKLLRNNKIFVMMRWLKIKSFMIPLWMFYSIWNNVKMIRITGADWLSVTFRNNFIQRSFGFFGVSKHKNMLKYITSICNFVIYRISTSLSQFVAIVCPYSGQSSIHQDSTIGANKRRRKKSEILSLNHRYDL